MKYKYIVLGGGPAGLVFANELKNNGINDFVLLEMEDCPGGLCKSKEVGEYPLDIGGGHFLDADNEIACNYAFKFMQKNEWSEYKRDSKIELDKNLINHPIESNIWQLPIEKQVEYLKSIAIAGCNIGTKMPEKFVEWIYWKLGNKIADDYMIPYNKKMFGDNLDLLGTYWLEKLPNVSFEDTLISCLERKAYGKEPGHTNFLYPKEYGYGELWNRMADEISQNIEYNAKITELNIDERYVIINNGIKIYGDIIITTIPWTSIGRISGMRNDLNEKMRLLKHTSVVIEYIDTNIDSEAHWIYYPNSKYRYHRILLRNNFLMKSIGHWTETNYDRFDFNTTNQYFINEYAYPLNTIDKPQIMKELLDYCGKSRVFGLGRWGEHQHYNSDKVVVLAISLANKLLN